MTTRDESTDDDVRARILDWASSWRDHRRSTAPADRPTAEAAVGSMFDAAGLSRPWISWAPSPGAGAQRHFAELTPVRSRWGGRHEIADDWITARRPGPLAGPGELPSGWLSPVVQRLVDALPIELPPSQWERDPLELLGAVAEATGLIDPLARLPEAEVERGLLRARQGPRTRATARAVRDGQFDAIVPALALGPDLLGIRLRRDAAQAARFRAFIDARLAIARSAGPWWVHGSSVIMTERPIELHVDAAGRLHAPDRPALAYGDGTTTFAWHGVRVPEELILDPSSITIPGIDAQDNTEIRRVMIERFGIERFVREGGAQLVDEDETGRLWERALPPARLRWGTGDDPIVMVEVENSTPEADGSRKTYLLRVPPTMRTAREAVAWTFGLAHGEYRPVAES